jgi:hypothetical protein
VDAKRPDSTPREQERAGTASSSGQHGGVGDGAEPLGPLLLRRMRKDDGRTLIVYSRELDDHAR